MKSYDLCSTVQHSVIHHGIVLAGVLSYTSQCIVGLTVCQPTTGCQLPGKLRILPPFTGN